MENENREKERAFNIIWNASNDYSFEPETEAFDESGKADIYLNYIIGAVRKYYDYPLLEKFFTDLREDAYYELLKSLMWIGLENCAYEKGKCDRPVIESLRRDYSRRLLSKCDTASANYLYDEIRIAHFQRALGEKPKMTGLASNILNDLEFDKSMDTEQIILRMNKIIGSYFRFGLIPTSYGQGKKRTHHHILPFFKLFKAVSLQYSGETNFNRKTHRLNKLSSSWFRFIELWNKHQVEYIKGLYGVSILSESRTKAIEQAVCCGNHRRCHLHFTRGEFDDSISPSRDAAVHKNEILKQRERNKARYQKNLARNNNSISRLTNTIRNAMQLDTESSFSRAGSGKFAAGKVWRNIYLDDEKIFIKSLKDNIGNIAVDIMLDASSSQHNRQEIIAAEGYIIAESFARCNIPIRVYSFFSDGDYTVINLFRDYRETYNDKIFNYYSSGCNRDGLAIRTALHMMEKTASEHKILIILSDGVPNDTKGIPKSELSRIKYDYIGSPGVNDTAIEVRKGRLNGIHILCIFTGLDEDIPDAKKIYGNNLACIKSSERFADTVGILMQNEFKRM